MDRFYLKRFAFGLLFLLCMIFCPLPEISNAGGPPKRIISLAPGITEILFTLGLGERIVGVTSFCDYPEEAKKKAKIGGMSNPSLEAVVSLRPDIVVMTTDGNPKEFEERLRSLKIRTYVYRARRLFELPKGVRDLGEALGVKERAEEFARTTEAALNNFKSHILNFKSPQRVLFIVWPEPLIAAGPGTVIDDAVNLIGAENIAAQTKTAYPKYSIEEILRRPPDVIFIGRGVGMEKVSQGLLNRLKNLPVVKNGRVFYVSDYLYRLGPRTIKGLGEISSLMEK